ncbi:hypothetical protein GCM10010272_00830 [Streptomyces lateritius]|nr:hypothetical protein GCM10010272_00830 [Streptomyces lateritius]
MFPAGRPFGCAEVPRASRLDRLTRRSSSHKGSRPDTRPTSWAWAAKCFTALLSSSLVMELIVPADRELRWPMKAGKFLDHAQPEDPSDHCLVSLAHPADTSSLVIRHPRSQACRYSTCTATPPG